MALFDFLKSGSPEDRFAERIIARLRAAGWPHTAIYDRASFSVATSPTGGVLYLDNAYRDWLNCPKREQAEQLDRIIAPVLKSDLVNRFEDAAPRLLLAVRSLADLQAMALDADDPSLDIWQPYQRVAGSLAALLIIDLPNGTALVSREMLKGWDKSFEELLPQAMDHLVASSPVRFDLTGAGFYMSAYDDGYDASRLLMPELFLALQLKGDPVAVAVTRNNVVVAGCDDAPALDAMASYVEAAFADATRPMSYLPLILRSDRRWEPFNDAAAPQRLRDLSIRQALWEQDLQATRLERLFAMQGRDIFVAPLEVVAPDDIPFTWTSWTEGVAAVLPKAHGIALTASDGRQVFRLWADVEGVCGPLDEDGAYHPSRYRPPNWPDSAAFERLEREFATPDWWVRAMV